MEDTTLKYELENQISQLIFGDNKNSAHFEYLPGQISTDHVVNVITYNPRTKGSFLLISKIGKIDYLEALQDIISDLKSKTEQPSYTIKWYYKGEFQDRPHKSVFEGRDIYEILDKFYFGKNKEDLIIYGLTANNVKSKGYEG